MNITPAQMYWLVKLDDIRSIIEGLHCLPILMIVYSLIGAIVFTIMYFFAGNGTFEMFSGKTNEEFQNIRETLWKWRGTCMKLGILSVVFTVVISLASILIPSTKQMAAIMIVPRIANSEKVQTIGNKVYDLAVEWMEELKPNKGSEVKE